MDSPQTCGDRAVEHRHGERGGLEPRAAARRARDLAHVRLDLLAGPVRVRLAVAALEPVDEALVAGLVAAHAPVAVAVAHEHRRAAGAVEEQLAVLLLQLAPRRVQGELAELGGAAEEPREVPGACARPRRERAVGDRERGVGHDQLRVDLVARAEPRARRARAVGRVEREVPRRGLVEADPAVRAGELLGEERARTSRSRPRRARRPPPSRCRGAARSRRTR